MTVKNPKLTKRGNAAGDGGAGEGDAVEGTKAATSEPHGKGANGSADSADGGTEVTAEAAPSGPAGPAANGSADPADGGAEVRTGEARSDSGETAEGPGWTEGTIERLLSTMDAVSSDAAESRSMLERLTGGSEERVRVQTGDFHRWVESDRFRRKRWTAAAVAAAAPAALLLGILVEQQFQVIPLHDPSAGWSAHVWENYGRTIVNCAAEAMRTGSEVDCLLVVRRP